MLKKNYFCLFLIIQYTTKKTTYYIYITILIFFYNKDYLMDDFFKIQSLMAMSDKKGTGSEMAIFGVLFIFLILALIVFGGKGWGGNQPEASFVLGKNTQKINDILANSKATLEGQVVINNNVTNRANETNTLLGAATVGTRELVISNYNELTALINTLPKV